MDPMTLLDPELRERIAGFCRSVLAALEGAEATPTSLPRNAAAGEAPDPLAAALDAIVRKYGPLTPGLERPPALHIPFVEIPAPAEEE